MTAMTTAKAAEIKTAAADTSLATFAFGEILGLAISTTFSSTVLISSETITKEIVRKRTTHSKVSNFRKYATATTTKEIKVCIRKFGSFLKASLIPSIAKPKLETIPNFLLIFTSIQQSKYDRINL